MAEALNLDELERLAIDAKEGVVRSDGWAGTVEMGDHLARDEAFIKAASPDAVLALVARVRELEQAQAVPAARVVTIAQGRNAGKQVVMLRDLPNGTELYAGPQPGSANP